MPDRYCWRPEAWNVSDLAVMSVSQTSIISLLEHLLTEDFCLTESWKQQLSQIVAALCLCCSISSQWCSLDYSLILGSSKEKKNQNKKTQQPQRCCKTQRPGKNFHFSDSVGCVSVFQACTSSADRIVIEWGAKKIKNSKVLKQNSLNHAWLERRQRRTKTNNF